ncbi:MAG: hypothetical protein P8Y30_04015 [candidate division WOR-3 bacterium]
MTEKDIAIIIPAFNEKENLLPLMQEIDYVVKKDKIELVNYIMTRQMSNKTLERNI